MIWSTVILPEHIRWKDIISSAVKTVKIVKSMVLLFHSDRICILTERREAKMQKKLI